MEKLRNAIEKQLDKILLPVVYIKGSIEGISGMCRINYDWLLSADY